MHKDEDLTSSQNGSNTLVSRRLIELYKQSNNIECACQESGIDVWLGQVILLEQGLIKVETNNSSKLLGDMAEEKFQELLPEAKNINKFVRKNNPGYDFTYKRFLIEVKYCSRTKNNNKQFHVSIHANKKADIFAAFLDKSNNRSLSNFDLLLIPAIAASHLISMCVIETGDYYKKFKITPGKLKFHLDKLNEFYEGRKRVQT